MQQGLGHNDPMVPERDQSQLQTHQHWSIWATHTKTRAGHEASQHQYYSCASEHHLPPNIYARVWWCFVTMKLRLELVVQKRSTCSLNGDFELKTFLHKSHSIQFFPKEEKEERSNSVDLEFRSNIELYKGVFSVYGRWTEKSIFRLTLKSEITSMVLGKLLTGQLPTGYLRMGQLSCGELPTKTILNQTTAN